MTPIIKRVKCFIKSLQARKRGNVFSGHGAMCFFHKRAVSNTIEISPRIPRRVQSKIFISVNGKDNLLQIEEGLTVRKALNITIDGTGNRVILRRNIAVADSLTLHIIGEVRNGRCTIGEGTTFWKTSLALSDHDSEISIGSDCMFSWNTTVTNTDSHAILVNGAVVNHAKKLTIGDHVWVGWDATILKNSHVASGSVIGRAALVSGKFTQEHAVLAGVPAGIIRVGVTWDRRSVNALEALPLSSRN